VNKQLAKNFVTKSEVEALYRSHRDNNIAGFKSLDTNHDGKLTYPEVVFKAPGIAKAFTFLDQGSKGYLAQSDFFQSRVLINFKSAISAQKLKPGDLGNTDLDDATASISAPDSVSTRALNDQMPSANESGSEVLPYGVMTWDQWAAAEAVNPEYSRHNGLMKVEEKCEADQCNDEIVVICGIDCGGGDGGGWGGGIDPITIEPIVVVDPGSDNGATTPDKTEKVLNFIKVSATLCWKSPESCAGDWSSRVIRDFCRGVSGIIPVVSTAVCTGVVNLEANVESCKNVACP
jgi:hypothetical protein